MTLSEPDISDAPFRTSGPDTVFIACAALGKEVRHLVRKHGWDVDVQVINAKLHLHPEQIGPAVEQKLVETKDRYHRQVVVYGHCGAMDLDDILAKQGAVRPLGPHCYEMYGGEEFVSAIREQPGTFFLTDFLVGSWDHLVVKGLGVDEYPDLKDLLFGNYTRVLYFAQEESADLLDKARRIADWLGKPLEVKRVGYGDLERRLAAIMSGKEQPVTTLARDDSLPYPTVE